MTAAPSRHAADRAAPDPDDADAPRPRPDRRRLIGIVGEQHARRHLERRGYTVIATQARTRHGEIDLVALDGPTLVFCEVKTRVARGASTPWTSLHERKRAQVRRLAAAWLAATPDRPRTRDVRFDAILVSVAADGTLRQLEQLEAAF